MKKVILSIVFFVAIISANAQNTKIAGPYKNVVKFNLPQFLFSTMQMGYEYRPDINKSFQVNLGITYKTSANDYYSIDDYVEGYSGELQIRLYPLATEKLESNLYNNFYIAPHVNYRYFVIKDLYKDWYYPEVQVYSTDRFSSYGMGIITGINSVINKRFHIDIYIGGGIRLANTKKFDDNVFDYGFKGITPRIGFDLGINL